MNVFFFSSNWKKSKRKKKIRKKQKRKKPLKYLHSLTTAMLTQSDILLQKQSHWSHWSLIWLKLLCEVLSYFVRVGKRILIVRSDVSFVGGSPSTYYACWDLFLKDNSTILQCQWETSDFICSLAAIATGCFSHPEKGKVGIDHKTLATSESLCCGYLDPSEKYFW